jgi:2-polyprenyl-6-methoxyphenol hydroxylase-like FAD-dependent oxidoreductase
MTLLNAAIQQIGGDRIHLGQQLDGFDVEPGGVRAWFLNRARGGERVPVEGRLLVACDGIHSAARQVLYPQQGPPKWNGAVLWRGVAESPPFLDSHTMIMAGHERTKFVCYPINHHASQAAAQVINFIAEQRFDEQQLSEREDWSRPGRFEDFLPAFESFRFDWLDVPTFISSAAAVWVYTMVDRDPMPKWTHGPVTQLGDAAHPMYPIGSNGASQAILDARVLTGCLRYSRDDLERGLMRYDEIRRPATSRIVLSNRQNGPEAVMQLVEDRAPNGFAKLDDVVSREELQSTADRYKQVAGFAVAELNARPSLAEPTP